jgi:hypothetical protein
MATESIATSAKRVVEAYREIVRTNDDLPVSVPLQRAVEDLETAIDVADPDGEAEAKLDDFRAGVIRGAHQGGATETQAEEIAAEVMAEIGKANEAGDNDDKSDDSPAVVRRPGCGGPRRCWSRKTPRLCTFQVHSREKLYQGLRTTWIVRNDYLRSGIKRFAQLCLSPRKKVSE